MVLVRKTALALLLGLCTTWTLVSCQENVTESNVGLNEPDFETRKLSDPAPSRHPGTFSSSEKRRSLRPRVDYRKADRTVDRYAVHALVSHIYTAAVIFISQPVARDAHRS